jgi:organic radical activating enzyme
MKQQYSEYKQQHMDPISPSFCGAKWFEATIWLYKGVTASCHHNPFHKIDLDPNNPASLHNTPQKITERNRMLNGEKPSGCNYCWDIEKNGGTSDRVLKTQAVPKEKIIQLNVNRAGITDNAMPYMLEIAFEKTCNLACAYCGPEFSSKWVNEIKKNGPYLKIETDSRYTNTKNDSIDNENNPYIEAFFKWLPKLEKQLKLLRVTGGEPLLSPNFWKFIDIIQTRDTFKTRLAINTNLINHKNEIDLLISKSQNLKIKIHTSLESDFTSAEYVRDGFDKDIWMNNVYKILDNTDWPLNITTSINIMGLFGLIDYLKLSHELKTKYGKDRVECSFNFVHYPIFMRINLLPLTLRKQIKYEIDEWTNNSNFISLLHHGEKENLKRFLSIMAAPEEVTETVYSLETAYKDLKSFISQYDIRREKNFRKSLDKRFINWYDKLK